MRLLLFGLIVLAGAVVFQLHRNDCHWHGSEYAVEFAECLTQL
jgi:hypothetical protein